VVQWHGEDCAPERNITGGKDTTQICEEKKRDRADVGKRRTMSHREQEQENENETSEAFKKRKNERENERGCVCVCV
jgi:hypothetical protein